MARVREPVGKSSGRPQKAARARAHLRGERRGALNEVRLALLEADVNYKVVKDFVAAVKEKALGAEVLASLSPDQHFIKIVHEEMTRMMGEQAQELNLARRPPVPVMLVGLQGSGKTTTCGKLALYLQKKKRTPFLVPADVYRPAAIELAEGPRAPVGNPGVRLPPRRRPGGDLPGGVEIRRNQRLRHGPPRHGGAPSHRRAADGGSPGSRRRSTREILLVADAMTGQDAVNVAKAFHESSRSPAWC